MPSLCSIAFLVNREIGAATGISLEGKQTHVERDNDDEPTMSRVHRFNFFRSALRFSNLSCRSHSLCSSQSSIAMINKSLSAFLFSMVGRESFSFGSYASIRRVLINNRPINRRDGRFEIGYPRFIALFVIQ